MEISGANVKILKETQVYRDGNSRCQATTACEMYHSLVEELVSSLVGFYGVDYSRTLIRLYQPSEWAMNARLAAN
jgi:hypothetical protein